MARPLRIEYQGAVYHITSRGDSREPMALDDVDRSAFIEVLAQALKRFDARAWAYCLMGDHYHLVLHTRQANLSRLMRHVNGVYTQTFNRRHGLVGHLFQGRFKAIVVDADSYLLEVCRYVDLNPVRAHLVQHPHAYAWSGYRAHTGQAVRPPWLDSKPLYAQLAPKKSQATAARKYAEFVAQGAGVNLWDDHLQQQIFLGGDKFIERMRRLAGLSGHDKPRARVNKAKQRRPASAKALSSYTLLGASRAERDGRIALAFKEGGYTQTMIATAFGVSSSTVSRVINEME